MGPLIAITRPQVYDMSIAKGARAFRAHVLAKCSVIRDFGALITRVLTYNELEALLRQAINETTPNDWKGFCKHVETLEHEYWTKDGIIEDATEDLELEIQSSESDKESDDNSSKIYKPSSCLSDKEEDEIYGFGYGVFSRQMLQQRQQKLALAAQNTTTVTPGGHQQPYQRKDHECAGGPPATPFEGEASSTGRPGRGRRSSLLWGHLIRGPRAHPRSCQPPMGKPISLWKPWAPKDRASHKLVRSVPVSHTPNTTVDRTQIVASHLENLKQATRCWEILSLEPSVTSETPDAPDIEKRPMKAGHVHVHRTAMQLLYNTVQVWEIKGIVFRPGFAGML
ncbi:hypothetical protein WN48_04243 [Eufriesea mexicana]|nr:hypothetical protein WN48_04243 [Eufriesea mexicana]